MHERWLHINEKKKRGHGGRPKIPQRLELKEAK
jgi:hypothetical protein